MSRERTNEYSGLRPVGRGANGQSQPKYARNPVTGMFERVVDGQTDQNTSRRMDERSPPTTRRAIPTQERRVQPSSNGSISRSLDDRTRDRDPPVRRTVERNQRPIDFTEMTQSIDELIPKTRPPERQYRRKTSGEDLSMRGRGNDSSDPRFRRKTSTDANSREGLSRERDPMPKRLFERKSSLDQGDSRRPSREEALPVRSRQGSSDIKDSPIRSRKQSTDMVIDSPVRSRQGSRDLDEPIRTRPTREPPTREPGRNDYGMRDTVIDPIPRERMADTGRKREPQEERRLERSRVASPVENQSSNRVLSPRGDRIRERDSTRERPRPEREREPTRTTDRNSQRDSGRLRRTEPRPSRDTPSPSSPAAERVRMREGTRSPMTNQSPASTDQDTDMDINEQERKEMERKREELTQKKLDKRVADAEEAKMVESARRQKMAEEQRKRQNNGGRSNGQYTLTSKSQPDTSCLVIDYVEALIQNLEKDQTPAPVPDDFPSPEEYQQWRSSMRRSFQSCLAKMLKYRFIRAPTSSKPKNESTSFRFRVVEAQGLISKDGKARSAYCNIEYGDLSARTKDKEVFRTETVDNSLDPVWNQNMTIETRSSSDKIRLEVMDRNKDHFLGQVIIPMRELINGCSRTGRFEKLYELEPRDKKDKYVGGRILVGASMKIDKQDKATANSYEDIQNTMESYQVDNRALYRLMVRSCLVLDLYTPREGRKELLSYEAVNMIKTWALTWNISEEYLVVGYVQILFEKFKENLISISDLKTEFELMYSVVKKSPRMHPFELNISLGLVDEMRNDISDKVVRYKELYPQNKPKDALPDTIFVLRMIHRFPGYQEQHPELPPSFRDELKILLTNSSISRFQMFKESCAPLDPSDAGQVVEGINQLSELVIDEIEQDMEFFRAPFASEIDIVRLNAETQLKYFTSVLDDGSDVISGDAAVKNASEAVFALYRNVKDINESYSQSVPGLSSLSITYIEEWFAPFIYNWLKHLATRTMTWVEAAVKADTFEPIAETRSGSIPLHSSSITDVFAAMYAELETISNLNWSDQKQNAQFYQAFGKTMNAAIENYSDVIMSQEKQSNATSTVTAFTQNLLGGKKEESKDIENVTCAKLRNIAFAQAKLKEMYQKLDVPKIMKALKIKEEKTTDNAELITGAFMINVAHGENMKPTQKSGSSNPYVYIKVPDGTVVPPPEEPRQRRKEKPEEPAPEPKPTILTGSACEILRSRYLNESLNPTWDETFTVILPPVDKLEVTVYSKNLLTFDDVCGTATIDLTTASRLRRKLQDNQTHDVFVDLEPQGRVLLRFTLEGEQEDIGFWFRKTNEKLIRTRNSFLRSLTGKITAFVQEVFQKAIKDNEAAIIPPSTFFQQLTSAVQYSDKTAAGNSINSRVTDADVNIVLNPLIDYLEKNLDTLCSQLPPAMSQAVIERVWTDLLGLATNLLIPPLYGLHSQKYLVPRQISMVDGMIQDLREFFHGDGGEFGLSFSILDSANYKSVLELMDLYHAQLAKVRREYDLSFLGGKDKEYLLRLVRLRAEKDSDEAKWVETTLEKRREQSRK